MAGDNSVTRYAKWVVNHPFIVIAVTLLLVAAGASGGRFENDVQPSCAIGV